MLIQELQELVGVRGGDEQHEAAKLAEADAVHALCVEELAEQKLRELQLTILFVRGASSCGSWPHGLLRLASCRLLQILKDALPLLAAL